MSLVWFCSSLYGKALHLKELNLVPSASFCYKRKGKIALRTKLLKRRISKLINKQNVEQMIKEVIEEIIKLKTE